MMMDPRGLSTVPDFVVHWARCRPGDPALAGPEGPRLSYAQLASEVAAIGRTLRGSGIRSQDVVVLAIPQGPEAALAFLAVSSAAVAAPINPLLRTADLAPLFADLRPRAVLVPAGAPSAARETALESRIEVIEFSGPILDDGVHVGSDRHAGNALEGLLEKPAPGDLALILPTSGTTSRSKLVPLTHANIIAAATNTSRALHLTTGDHCLNPMPLFHGHGLVAAVLASIAAGASVTCTPPFDAVSFVRWLDELGPTWYTAVPAIHEAILGECARQGRRPAQPPLRLIRSASAYLSSELRERLERTFGTSVSESYGLSEGLQLTNTPLGGGAHRSGSLGVPGTSQVAIMNAEGALLPPDTEGEIVCRGPNVMSGYLGRPEDNQRVFVDGWFRTGDVGRLDVDGHLYMVGRLKELINRGGEKVSPQEIDNVLSEHPGIQQAVAFAIPDPILGEEIAVAVIPRPGASLTAREVRHFAHVRLPEFKVPRRVFITSAIPLSPLGKPLRRELARHLGIGESAGGRTVESSATPTSAAERQMLGVWADVLGRAVAIDDDFFELGGGSLKAAELLLEIEHATGRKLSPAVLYEAPTPRELLQCLSAAGSGGGDRTLIELHRGEGGTPFVFLTGDYARVALYSRNLAARLDPQIPFYAMMPHAVDVEGAPTSIEEMASAFIQTLRTALPSGPYVLGGFSHAGLVAFEMARQLGAAGERIPLLVVIDMPVAAPWLRHVRRLVRAAARLRRLSHDEEHERYLVWRDRLERFDDLSTRGLRTAITYYRRRASGWRPAAEMRAPDLPPSLVRTAAIYSRMIREYVPRRYAGRVVLVSSQDGPAAARADETLGWRRVAREVTLHSVRGDHWSCVTEHIDGLAAFLNGLIQDARARAVASSAERRAAS